MSPPNNSNSPNKVFLVHEYTSNVPALLSARFFPELNTLLLRIIKPVLTSPPMGTLQILPYSPSPTSSTPGSSFHERLATESKCHPHYSSDSFICNSKHFASLPSTLYDQHSSADVQVGIGLSLLQSFMNEIDSSDEDEDDYMQ